MAASNNLLASLSPNADSKTIVVRVTRIWEAINKRTGAALHTNLILLDEKENHMVAIVRNNQKQIYLPMLKEGEVYSISNFKVVPGPKQYKSVPADYSISFFYRTKIERQDDSNIIPMYKFEIRPFTDVKILVGNVDMLLDVIGWVKSYGKLETRTNGAKKMDIVLADTGKESMVVTLWEDRALQFLDLMGPVKTEAAFVVITGLLAKKFSAAASLSSTDATRCYMNIKYPPLMSLKEALSANKEAGQESLPPPVFEQFVTSTGDGVKELPITSILETVIPAGTQVVRCICRSKIVAILDGNGWYYNCCPTCARSLGDLHGKHYCLACNEEHEQLAQRYRIVAKVEDSSGTTTVTLFNKEAEQLVGIPLPKILANLQEEGDMKAIPPAVLNIIGKSCAFQLKITPYNIIHGCEEYTVTRVFEEIDVAATGSQTATGYQTNTTSTSANKKQRVA